jgi:hypothetical protein
VSWFWLPLIAVINASALPDATIERWTIAVQEQVHKQFAPAWGFDATIEFFPQYTSVPNTAWILTVETNRHSLPGGHRTIDKERPIAYVNLARRGNPSVTLSHEILEMLANPHVNRYVEDTDIFYFLEVADPVQDDADAYPVKGVLVSDFVFPAWFDGLELVPQRYDFVGHTRVPRKCLPGGYIQTLNSRTGVWEWHFGS